MKALRNHYRSFFFFPFKRKTSCLLLFMTISPCLAFFLQANETNLSEWNQLLQTGLKNNPSIKKAQARFQEATGAQIEARAILMPKLFAQAISLPPVAFIEFRQPVYNRLGGSTLRAAKQTELTAQFNYQIEVLNFTKQLRDAYVKLIFLQQRLSAQTQYANSLQKQLDTLPSLFESGRARKKDISRTEVNYAFAKNEILQTKKNIQLEQITLAEILGVKASHPHVLSHFSHSLNTQLPPSLNSEELTKTALQLRPDLQILDQLSKIKKTQISIAASNYYPTLDGFARGVFQQKDNGFLGELGDQRDENDDVSSQSRVFFGALIEWKAVESGRTTGKKRQAEAQYLSSQIAYQKLKRQVPRQVEASLRTIERIDTLIQELENSSEPNPLQAAQKRFQSGEISQFELFQVERDIFQKQITSLELQSNLEQAKTNLLSATGQLTQITLKPSSVD